MSSLQVAQSQSHLNTADTKIGRWLRGRIHARLNKLFQSGDHVLALSCGTGEDARHLAGHGITVTATDSDPQLLEIAKSRSAHTPLASFVQLDLTALPEQQRFDPPLTGAFGSFGAINQLSDWKPLAQWLAARIPSGNRVAFGVMSPYCLWQIGWYGLRLNFRAATQRLYPRRSAETLSYPRPRRLAADFAPYFKQIHLEGLALFLPISDGYHSIETRPLLLNVLTGMDERLAQVKRLAILADYYWIELERTTQQP